MLNYAACSQGSGNYNVLRQRRPNRRFSKLGIVLRSKVLEISYHGSWFCAHKMMYEKHDREQETLLDRLEYGWKPFSRMSALVRNIELTRSSDSPCLVGA